jgi:hypothetical protein
VKNPNADAGQSEDAGLEDESQNSDKYDYPEGLLLDADIE